MVQFFIGEVPLFESSAGTFIGSETNQVDALLGSVLSTLF